MDLSLDVFSNPIFGVAALQRSVMNTPFIPTMLGDMGLFENRPLTGTDKVIIYEEDGGIRLIPTTERGTPDIQQLRDVGRFFALETKRLAKKDTLRASELLNIANVALPDQIRIRNAATVLDTRTQKLKSDMEATKELHRLGALFGKLLDADGTTVLVDYWAEFGLSAPAAIDFDFDTIDANSMMMFIQANVVVPMKLALRTRATPNMRLAALVGDGFWAKLMTHPAFVEMYKQLMNARAISRELNPTMTPNNWTTINYAGVDWINYQGSTSGVIAVPYNEARFFPIGAQGVFQVFWAPGETLPQVAAPGEPQYLMIQPDVNTNMPTHVDVFLRSYPLYACTFPKCLLRGKVHGT